MFGENIIISSVFIAGFLSFFAPCTFALIPVYIGLLTDQSGEYKTVQLGSLKINVGGIINTIGFVLGLSMAFVILGFGAGVIGRLLYNRWVTIIGGLIIVILGLHQMELIKLPGLSTYKLMRFKNDNVKFLRTFIMGFTFSLGWTPCVGPVLGAVLLTSASSGQAFYGAFLMMVYALGLMIPFLIMAIASSALLSKFEKIEKHLPLIKRIGGALIVMMGLFLMTNQLMAISVFLERIFG